MVIKEILQNVEKKNSKALRTMFTNWEGTNPELLQCQKQIPAVFEEVSGQSR